MFIKYYPKLQNSTSDKEMMSVFFHFLPLQGLGTICRPPELQQEEDPPPPAPL